MAGFSRRISRDSIPKEKRHDDSWPCVDSNPGHASARLGWNDRPANARQHLSQAGL